MEIGIEILMTVIELPLWAVVATALAGAVVGMFLLMVAVMLLGRSKKSIPAAATAKAVTESVKSATPEIAKTRKPYKPVPPLRQHHWYYIKGVDGRFATLREAFAAIGEEPPKTLDWRKLPQDIRSRITRTPVDGKQPEPMPEKTDNSIAKVAPRMVTKVGEQDDDVIRKPIGGGAFVTIRKKRK